MGNGERGEEKKYHSKGGTGTGTHLVECAIRRAKTTLTKAHGKRLMGRKKPCRHVQPIANLLGCGVSPAADRALGLTLPGRGAGQTSKTHTTKRNGLGKRKGLHRQTSLTSWSRIVLMDKLLGNCSRRS